MSNSKKVLLIGWDAADWKVIHPLLDAGRMPNLQRLIERGAMGNMATLSPVLSPMLWTSIATGKRPHKHGIYGFIEPAPDRAGVQPMTNISRRSKAIWNILNQQDLRSIVVGWWPSHPAEPINGVMVSDFFSKAPKHPGQEMPILPGSVHPSNLTETLASLRVHPEDLRPEHILPFIPRAAEIDQETDSRLSPCLRVIAECTTVHHTAVHLLETEPWDFAAIYYDAIDHFCHGYMQFHPPRQAHISQQDFDYFHNVVTMGYLYHDMMLGRLLQETTDETTVILLSDHGFHPDHLRAKNIPAEPAGPALEHRDYGVFVIAGPNVKRDHIIFSGSLLDITPTILPIYDLPIGEDMDGKPLVDLFEVAPDIRTIASWEEVAGDSGEHPKGHVVSATESRQTLEQLIALGYIDRPNDDHEIAIADCQRELDFNLARSYMDCGMHGEAVPLLAALYRASPLEFRYGIQLATSLRAMNRNDDLVRVIDDLNSRWRLARGEALKRLHEFAAVAQARIKQKTTDSAREAKPDTDFDELGRDKNNVFSAYEKHQVKRLRGIARGNPQTLDFLSATVAMARGDYELALDWMLKAKMTTSSNPNFYFHLGNVYLELKSYSEATEFYEKALALDECHCNALMGLCRVSLQRNEVSKALDFGRRATGLKFHFPVGHYYLGIAKQRSNDRNGAIVSWQRAIQQNPNFPEAHEQLAKAHHAVPGEEALEAQHRNAARQLKRDNVAISESQQPIELPNVSADELQTLLPAAPDDDAASEFVRCLGLPKQYETAEAAFRPQVVVVSGLPRSGTSLMMQMLAAGGMKLFTDRVRASDISNPKGYFEAELVKQLASKNRWVEDCDQQAVKIVAPLLQFLPQSCNYKIIMMERDIREIVLSQTAMLDRLAQPGADLDPDRLAELLLQQVAAAKSVAADHGIPLLSIDYRDVLAAPDEVSKRIAGFLPVRLEIDPMVAAVDPNLYRQRAV